MTIAPIHIGIPPRTQVLFLERVLGENSYWRVWISTKDRIHGTFYELHDDGSMFVTTVRVDRGDETIQVKEKDK